jgi:opacity protein-like surface antigen
MRWWTVPLAAIGFVHGAGAAELDSEILRGSVVPTYRVDQGAPSSDDAALRSRLVIHRVQAAANARPPSWNWTGLYIGGYVGGALSITHFSDPFGVSMFGDAVRSPGFLGGGQIGYNWQPAGLPWVFGLGADVSGLSSDGTSTCFAASALTINTTCRVRPQAVGTITGRIGYAMGPANEWLYGIDPQADEPVYGTDPQAAASPFRSATLIYGKAGLGWANDQINMALNNDLAGGAGPAITSNSTSATFWGWTVGFGVEHALTRAWSLNVEYDYLALGSRNVANLGSATFSPLAVSLGVAPSGASGVAQDIHMVKVGVNYKWGADPWQRWDAAPAAFPVKAPAMQAWFPGWEVEGGGRYFGSGGQFHKDIGFFTNSGVSPQSSVSRLTYDGMQTSAGELFGRIDTPWNVFVKGYIGGGFTSSGQMNDEDFGIPLGGTYAAYSNTLAGVTGNTSYGAIDGGVDFLRGPGYKVGAFGGYFYFHQSMSAFGCQPVANINCIPNVPATGSANITEDDTWQALRIGVSGEAVLTDRMKITGEVAYLPYVNFSGVDHHFFGNTGQIASVNPESSNRGAGVQLEALVSYYLTPQFSLGVGGRYWALWTTDGQVIRTIDNGLPVSPLPPQFFKGAVEQAGVFVQATYSFGSKWFSAPVVAKY